jgi:hypothetical protein
MAKMRFHRAAESGVPGSSDPPDPQRSDGLFDGKVHETPEPRGAMMKGHMAERKLHQKYPKIRIHQV